MQSELSPPGTKVCVELGKFPLSPATLAYVGPQPVAFLSWTNGYAKNCEKLRLSLFAPIKPHFFGQKLEVLDLQSQKKMDGILWIVGLEPLNNQKA